MRKMLFTIIALTATLHATAQSYLSILQDGKEWSCYQTNGFMESYSYFYLNGDTVVDGNPGYKLFLRYVAKQNNKTLDNNYAVGALFEKDGCVYSAEDGITVLKCDMRMGVGDITPDGQWQVTDADHIYVMGRTLRRLTLNALQEDISHPNTIYWIEGVGSSLSMDIGSSAPLVRCNENGQCIFTDLQLNGMPERRTEPDGDGQLLEEGKEWWYNYEPGQWLGLPQDFRLFIQGDTIVGGRTWKKLYHDHTPGAVPEYAKALRKEEGRVYELTDDGGSRLLLDFTLTRGNGYDADGSYKEVIATDTLISGDHAHYRLILQAFEDGLPTKLTSWIRSVGSDYGIDADGAWSRQDIMAHENATILYGSPYLFIGCLKANGQLLYGKRPSTPTSVTARTTTAHPATFFDLQGRRLPQQPQRGVYIKNGRKVR